MAQPTNTFSSFDAVGNHEDLSDKIYQVSPEEVPVSSAARKGKAYQRLVEWQRDALAAPNKDNAVIEGDDRTGTALTATNRVANTTQLFDAVVVVSDTQENTRSAGRSSEIKYQKAKKMIELRRDVEAALLSNNAAVQGNDTTARKAGGLGVQIYTNVSHGVGGSTASHTSGLPTTAPTAGTARAFAESQLKTVMQSIFTNSGKMPGMVSVTPSHKGGFSAFTGIASNRYNVAKGKQGVIVGGADVYMSDFGELTIVPNYVQATANSGTAFILNPDELELAFLIGYESIPLAKTGHTEKHLVRCEVTFKVTAEAAHGKLADLIA